MAVRELIQRIDVASATAGQIEFINIPQGYTDLVIRASVRLNSASPEATFISFNGSSSNFSGSYTYGNGSAVSSNSLGRYIGSSSGTYTSNAFNNTEITILNYTSSAFKTFTTENVTENNSQLSDQNIISGLWSSANPINSISLVSSSGASWIQYSSASLYGIKRGSDGTTGPTATGGTVTTSGGYTYHTFTTSGSFQVNKTIAVDVLTVAGGAGGGATRGGGGGAGGYIASSLQLSPQQYPIVVGAGGAGGSALSSDGFNGFSGTNSVFGTLFTAIGGGFGPGNNTAVEPGSGGSGGGAILWGGTGGAGTAGQGNAGGNSPGYLISGFGAGGGGAGAVGGNATSTTIGSGGAGLQWVNGTYYAGGGGGGYDGTGTGTGGTGGTGGGGNGGTSVNTAGTAGTANTGGGGGGGSRNSGTGSGYAGAAGGSGVVIIRYLTPA